MATTNETMKVIANGIKQKEMPETILEGRIIRLDLPEETVETLAGIFSMIGGLEERKDTKVALAQDNNNGAPDDDYDKIIHKGFLLKNIVIATDKADHDVREGRRKKKGYC